MYVVQPPWLVEMAILPPGLQVDIASKLNEPGFRFTSPKLKVRWVVAPNRIMLDTKDPSQDCGKEIVQVLSSLPWTPLTGVGNNSAYTAPLSDIETLPEALRSEIVSPSGYSLVQRTLHFGVSREDRTFNIQLSVTAEELELSFNVHTELGEKGTKEANRIGCEAAGRFFADRKDAETLAKHYFKVGIDNVNSDTESS